VDVVGDQKGIDITLDDVDHSIRIPVVEKTVAENRHVPAAKRMWELIVPKSCLTLGLEILQLTSLMIWGARKYITPRWARKSEFIGKISFANDSDPLNLIIFHPEAVREINEKPFLVNKGINLTSVYFLNLDKQRTKEKDPKRHF